jgi:HlyD family secretion protein
MIERVESRKRLFKEGLITKQQLQTTTVQLQTAEDTIADLNADLGRLRLDDLTSDKRHDAEVRSSEFEIREAERRMGFLVEKLALSTEILSVHTGRVLELRAGPGDVVTTGAPLLSIELAGDDSDALEALIYIPSAEGKQVKPGMTVRVAPSVARPEEHGMVMATVTSVAEFPSTSRGMMRVLDNQELVNQLIRQTAGAPIAVRVVLNVDEQTPSGYRWSSGDGPDLRLTSGTSCAATVTTELQRPISLVVPAFRKWLGL